MGREKGAVLMKILDKDDVKSFIVDVLKILRAELFKKPKLPMIVRKLKKQIWRRIEANADKEELVGSARGKYIEGKKDKVKEIFAEELVNWEETKELFKTVIKEVRKIGGR